VDSGIETGRSAYSVRVGRDITAAGAALDASRRDESVQRNVLLARRRDRMAIEALIERQREAAKQEARRKQIRRDDEWTARNWVAGNKRQEGQR
jgi:hypothetical protein